MSQFHGNNIIERIKNFPNDVPLESLLKWIDVLTILEIENVSLIGYQDEPRNLMYVLLNDSGLPEDLRYYGIIKCILKGGNISQDSFILSLENHKNQAFKSRMIEFLQNYYQKA
jgi:hypothetical protein